MPAQQCLEALDAEVGEIDHRLVVDLHFLVRERLLEIGLDLLVLEQTTLHLGIEQADAVAAGRLGFIKRHVGMAQQLRLNSLSSPEMEMPIEPEMSTWMWLMVTRQADGPDQLFRRLHGLARP